MLNAALILTIMMVPIITSVTREVFETTPLDLKEGAYALGSTRWEMVRMVVLPYGRPGVTGAVILGLGRALGEAIAVTQVIGNTPGHPHLAVPARGHAGGPACQRVPGCGDESADGLAVLSGRDPAGDVAHRERVARLIVRRTPAAGAMSAKTCIDAQTRPHGHARRPAPPAHEPY